jgi:peptidoglycan hydrolase-like protein with peptidoglycan-binding domain
MASIKKIIIMKLLKSKILLGVMIFAVAFIGFAVITKAETTCDLGTVTLKQGMSGTAVTCLQTKLAVTPMTGYFGSITKGKVVAFQAAHSLTADGVVGPLTKAALGLVTTPGTTTTGTTTLSGGAGDIDITTSSSGIESSVKEGDENVKVLAFKAEGDGSDIAVTSMKIALQNDGYNAGDGSSEKLTNYIDEVTIWQGSTKIGSVDASDFTRDSDSPDVYSKTVAISNATVKENVKSTFYVAVTANSSIDSEDMDDASWNVDVQTLRYVDATGAIMSSDLTGDHDQNFSFDDITTDDDISIKSSTSNPIATNISVEANKNSDSVLVGAFKLDVGEDSSDISVLEIPVELTVDDASNTASSDDAEDIIDTVTVKIDGEEYEADLDSETITDGDGAAIYLVTLDNGDLTIEADEQAEVKVYVTFNDQSGNYGSGTTVYAKVTGSDIDAEGSDDDITVTGTFTGKTHTLVANTVPVFSLVSKSLSLYQAIDGVAAGEEDIFLAKFVFNVTAGDADVYLTKGVEGDANYTAAADTIQYTQLGGGSVDSAVIEAEDETLDDGLTSSFLISEGNTEKFTLSFFVRGNDEAEKFTINSFAYGTADDTSVTYDYNSVVNSGLSSFTTNSVYLAK